MDVCASEAAGERALGQTVGRLTANDEQAHSTPAAAAARPHSWCNWRLERRARASLPAPRRGGPATGVAASAASIARTADGLALYESSTSRAPFASRQSPRAGRRVECRRDAALDRVRRNAELQCDRRRREHVRSCACPASGTLSRSGPCGVRTSAVVPSNPRSSTLTARTVACLD